MKTRRAFLRESALMTAGSFCIPSLVLAKKYNAIGIQLYSVRNEMMKDAIGTLKQLAAIGYKELESARSDKGNYYGLKAKEIKKITSDLGMTVRSGHVHMDKDWQKTIDLLTKQVRIVKNPTFYSDIIITIMNSKKPMERCCTMYCWKTLIPQK
jgi:hypothetical protein